MSSKLRKRKPSERVVNCFYCSEGLLFKNLERHTEQQHGNKKLFPPREKGIMSLLEFTQKKKQKVDHGQQKQREQPTENSLTTLVQKIVIQISDAVKSLFSLLSPFRNAVSSLEKSADKIEKLLQEDHEARAHQIRTYSNHETFAREHKSEGLIVRSSSDGKLHGICMLCTKHTTAIQNMKTFESGWVTHGRHLDNHKKRTWQRHLQSRMHKEAHVLESQVDLSVAFTAGAEKAKMLTQNFLRLAYSSIMMFLPYRQLTRLFTTLHLCGFEIGNRNMTEHSGADACDTFYDYIFDNLSNYICSFNPCTGRGRCFGITADKGTEVNQRQVINIHFFDVDGKLVCIQLAAHIINEIDISNIVPRNLLGKLFWHTFWVGCENWDFQTRKFNRCGQLCVQIRGCPFTT